MATVGELNWNEECGIEWLIKDFFSLSTDDEISYSSPLFVFHNISWCLCIHPNGKSYNASRGFISLYLHRMSLGPPIKIDTTLGVKTKDGMLDPVKRIIFFFRKKEKYGYPHYICRTKVFNKKNRYAPSDTLTVACRLQHTKCTESESKENSTFRNNKVLKDYKQLFLKQNDCDVILKLGGKEFPAHRIILSARSPVFESTFRNDMKEKRTGIVNIEDCDPSTFLDFLCFLYCGDTEFITVENVFSLYIIADKYDVSDLRETCVEFVKENLSVDTFCDTLTLALQYSQTELITLTTHYFIRNGKNIVKSLKWQSFIASNPSESNELLVKTFESLKHMK